MEKEDLLLGIEMERLEIEPAKFNNSRSKEKPFIIYKQKAHVKMNAPKKEIKCTCSLQSKSKQSGIHKKKSNKILKDPVLKILKKYNYNNNLEGDTCREHSGNDISEKARCDPLNLCTLVDNCNQLKISSNLIKQPVDTSDTRVEHIWWKSSATCSLENKDQRQQASSSSCSQQALNPPCDVTIDELASYFETLVHIPKKMSSMAEMMYI